MNLADPALTFAIALAAGVLAQAVALHLRVPGIILLLVTGVLLGPELANVVRPDELGEGLQPIVGLSVAVILFEGGLQLNVDRLRREAITIRRLITVGALITLTGGMLASMLALGWTWQIALLFGTLVTVTGPTVINPLTRRIGLRKNLRTILEAEGVLIDPIGAILAVVALEMILTTSAAGAAAGLLGLPYRIGLGLVIGLAGGLAIGGMLRLRQAIPGVLRNVFTLSFVLALYQVSHAILPESGIMTVAIAGLVVGNIGTLRARELVEFKEQLTWLLVGLLFVLLAAAVDLSEVLALGWGGLVTVLVLIAIVRPLNVLLATMDSELEWRERAFLAWLAPRGIVAFAVSSLFAVELAHEGMAPQGEQLRALVFLVIATTVIVQGGTGGIVARLLHVRMRTDYGFTIVGANPVGRLLARALREGRAGDEPIVLVDTNPSETHAAQAEGFRVAFGNASEESTLFKADVQARRAFVALTPNEGVNLLLANRVSELYPGVRRLVSLDPTRSGVMAEQVHESGADILFAAGVDYERWSHELRQNRVDMGVWTYEGKPLEISEMAALFETPVPALALVHRRGKREMPVAEGLEIRAGDQIWFAWVRDQAERVAARLTADGWKPGPDPGGRLTTES